MDYLQANRMRTVGMNHLKAVFEKVDVIITPTVPSTAPKIPKDADLFGVSDINTTGKFMKYQFLSNLLGIPAISIPAGFVNELPVGVQFMASW